MKTIKYLSIILLIISCKDDFEGPSLNDVFGPFELIQDFTSSADTINFEQENNMFFQAEFSRIMNWKITIQGNITGSKKEITGSSKDLNIQNSTWNGNTTILPFFKKENCNVTLSFVESDTTFSTQVYVSSPMLYNDEESVLITDFEGGLNPLFDNYFQPTCTKSIESDNPAEGNRYLKQTGWCDWDWLIGYIEFYTQYWQEPNSLFSDPDSIFLNIMVYSDSATNLWLNNPNTLFKIEVYEDDNQDNYYDSSSEDVYELEIPVNWNGWRMISLRYGDDFPNESKGNSIKEPNKIFSVKTLVLSNPDNWSSDPASDPQARADIDYLIWTKNQPILEK